MRPPSGRALADGVGRAESLAIMRQLGRPGAAATASLTAEACTLVWDTPNSMTGCTAPVPHVQPADPWLQHSGGYYEPEQREPIQIAFTDTARAITLSSDGSLKCTGTYGRLVGFRDGVQVAQADNQLIDPSDCGDDDVTYGVKGELPANVPIDSLVIEGVDPWTFDVLGNPGRALLRYTIQVTVACDDTVRAIIAEYTTYNVNVRPKCAHFATDGGSTHFRWPELNDNWSTGNPHRPWGMIKQGLLDGLEATRTNYNRGGIILTSGYRCPHGNAAVSGATNSFHMHGRAADMHSADHPWTEDEFNLLKAAADATAPAPVESLNWDTYTDHHFHAAW